MTYQEELARPPLDLVQHGPIDHDGNCRRNTRARHLLPQKTSLRAIQERVSALNESGTEIWTGWSPSSGSVGRDLALAGRIAFGSKAAMEIALGRGGVRAIRRRGHRGLFRSQAIHGFAPGGIGSSTMRHPAVRSALSSRCLAGSPSSPGRPKPTISRHGCALAFDQPAETLEAIEQSKLLGYDDLPLAALRAILQARAGRSKEAEPTLTFAFHQASEPQVEIARELAKIYLATFRLAPAAAPIERVRLLDPDDPQPYLWQNEIDSRADADPATLIQNYRAALERDPTWIKRGLASPSN